MDTTRIVRVRVKAAVPERTVAGRVPGTRPPLPPSAPPVAVPPAPVSLEPGVLERWVLVSLVLGRERAGALLEGLPEPDAMRARGCLAGFTALSSARRQARVAVDFGVRPDAVVRLRQVMDEAPAVLRGEVFRRMPSFHRGLFPAPSLDAAGPELTDAVRTWAERLVREATR